MLILGLKGLMGFDCIAEMRCEKGFHYYFLK